MSLAALKRDPSGFLRRLGLDVSLSFIPNDKMTLVTDGVVGVLCFKICVACVILAPGKQSVCILLSEIVGRLAMLESPMTMMDLVGCSVQFSYFLPLWA